MNKIYKRVFNQSLGQYVVASENAKGHGKSATVGRTTKLSQAINSASKAVSNFVFTLSAVSISMFALTASVQVQAESIFQYGPYANSQSYLENTNYNYSDTSQHFTSSNINMWEDIDHITPADQQINVSDLMLTTSSWWESLSEIHGDRNVLLGNGNSYNGGTAQIYNHGSNNTALITGYGLNRILGNNNTYIGSSPNDNSDTSQSSASTNAILSKQAKYGLLSQSEFENIIDGEYSSTVESLISKGMTEDEIYGLGFEQWTDETGKTTWHNYQSVFRDTNLADFSLFSNVGHTNTVNGNYSLVQGDFNAMIGDSQFSGGNNNVLTGVGANVLKGNNNVVTGTYTSLTDGSNNILIMSKDAEQSKYVYKSYNIEPTMALLSLDPSESLSNDIESVNNPEFKYSGNFESDYKQLVNRYLNVEYDFDYDQYHPDYLAGSDLEYFMKKRADLYKHYGYSSGISESSILVGSTGDFSADQGIALGQNATVLGFNSIALGANSVAVEDNVIAAGYRKLMHIQDGSADIDLINMRQATAWSDKMIKDMQPHVDFVNSLKPDGPLYPTIRDVTADEVLTIINPNLQAGTEGVRSDLLDTKLGNEVNRAEAEILNALEIKKNAEVAKAENNINLDVGNKGSISSGLNEAILGYGTVESEMSDVANQASEDLVAQGSEKLDDLTKNAFKDSSKTIADLYDDAATGLDELASAGFNIQPSNDATDADDDIHTSEINNLISSTITGLGSDGEVIITDSLTKAEQDELGQKVKENSDSLNLQLVQNFENYQQNTLGHYKNDLQAQLEKGVNDAISNIDNLAKVEDQVMLKEVGSIADEADNVWAKEALEQSKVQISNATQGIIDFASEEDRLLLTSANSHVDAADQAMIEEAVSNLNDKDDAVKAELNQTLKDGDVLVANTAIELATDLDAELKDALISLADTTHESLLSGLKTVADDGDKALFNRFDEFLKSAESADISRIMAEVKAGDENTYRQVVDYADQGDANTLAEAQGYIDQKYGELNDALKNSEDKLNASIASSLATASVPSSNRAGKALLGFGTGHYGGQSALALGASTMTTSKKFSFGVTASMDTQHENSGSFSVGYYW